MRTTSIFLAVLLIVGVDAFARAVSAPPLNVLIEKSAVVFVGEVQTVKPSGITTDLTYPMWKDAVFEWLDLQVQVKEPVKGTTKDTVVSVLALSTQASIDNRPGFIFPKKGARYLFCLLPTPITNKFAAVTAPFDEDRSIFTEDRTYWLYPTSTDNSRDDRDAYASVAKFIDRNGGFTAKTIARLRKTYKKEIEMAPRPAAIIHLKWKKQTSESGWQWNAPDESAESKRAPGDRPR
jgi:hypothetical protein